MDHRRNLREAAESLLNSVPNPYVRTPSMSQSASLNLVTEDLVAGRRQDGRMSTVRRFFCLFVTFDLLFTGLMWLICVMLRGETLRQILSTEILHYRLNASLFDVVMAAVARFTVLLLFYALLYINNWSVIALSTGGTCAFLIAKVFMFDWPNASQPVYEVFLILTSFTLSWGEAWFLDFRVLPQEAQAREIIGAIERHAQAHAHASERTPLLGAGGAGAAGGAGGARSHPRGDSTVDWFSPVESPAHTPRSPGAPPVVILTQEQIDEYKSMADESVQTAWRVLRGGDWRREKCGSQRGDLVESTRTDKFGKVYRFTGVVECPAKFLYEELRDNMARLPDWNPTILKSELIKEIAPGVDLMYQVTAGGGRGIIAPRDFVILRRATALAADGRPLGAAVPPPDEPRVHAYMSCGVSVQVPGYPPCKNMVRGHNKVACWVMRPGPPSPAPDAAPTTVFQWLMCCDLKGKIPEFVLDTAFSTVMLDYIVHVRRHVANAKAKGLF